jgi:hypothetical protein
VCPTPSGGRPLLLALISLSFAEDPAPKLVFDTAAAVASTGKTFDQGPAHVEFGEGVLVPFHVENASGVAFSGMATLSATFADRGDAQHLANQQVLRLAQPVADWAELAHGGPLKLTVSRAIILGDADSVASLLVGPASTAAAFSTNVVQKRFETLEEALDIEFNTRKDGDSEGFLVADFLGDRPLGYVRSSPTHGAAEADRYLTVVHQPTSWGFGDDLVAIGKAEPGDVHRETIALGPWTEPPTRRMEDHTSWSGVEPIKVTAKILTKVVGGGFAIAVTGEATYRFRAARDLHTVRIEDPSIDGRRKPWVVTKLQVGGVDVPVPPEPDEGFDVPVPAKAGAESEIHIEWTDTWPFNATTDEGRSIWPQFPLPGVVTKTWPFELKFGTYEDDKMASACSGLTAEQSNENGVIWVMSTSNGNDWPRCGIGAWKTYAEPPRGDFPGLRVALFKDEAKAASSVPPFARTVIAFYEGLLPPLPTEEVEIVQVPDEEFRLTWTSTLGVVTLQQMQMYGFESLVRAKLPHLEEGTLAHEIAHQWWGALVDNARIEDRWFLESLSETYACVFLAAAYGPKTCATREHEWQTRIESREVPRVSASLTRAPSRGWGIRVYQYGPYILNHTRRRRIGDQAFFQALDLWSRDRANTPASTAGLQHAFEVASGQDLAAFFDQWVDDGFIPALSGEWSPNSVIVRSDIPFGTIEVPVSVIHADGSTESLWLAITDGAGKLTLRTPATRVVLDPEELVPASSRKLVPLK